MKLLKSTLFIIAMVVAQPISARTGIAPGSPRVETQPVAAPQTGGGRPAPAQVTPDTSSKGSFKYYLNRIRTNMASEFVIDKQGVFTPNFESLIKSSGLQPEAMQALMQAGRNLHLPLLGNDQQYLEAALNADKRIDNFMRSTNPIVKMPHVNVTPLEAPAVEELVYYDASNGALRQDYLEQRITELSAQGKSSSLIKLLLQGDLSKKMRDAWNAHNVTNNILNRLSTLNKQIETTVDRLSTQTIEPIKLEPLQQDLTFTDIEEILYYDEDNATLKQNYLEERVRELLRTKTGNQTIAILEPELIQKMRRSWADHNIGSIPTRIKELSKQIKDTVMKFASPNTNLIWGDEVLPTGNPVWGGQVKNENARPSLTKRAEKKLAAANQMSPGDYASFLANDKFFVEIESLYKIGATKGSALLDLDNPNFKKVVMQLADDIDENFPALGIPAKYIMLQKALFKYYNTNTPFADLDRAEKRIHEIIRQNGW